MCKLGDSVGSFDACSCPGRRTPGIVSKMISTIKTHKPVGQANARAIHSCTLSSFEGLARWIHNQLSSCLLRFTQLCFSSPDVIERMHGVKLLPDDVFLHVDVGRFFMSGRCLHLTIRASSLSGDAELRFLRHDVMMMLLSHQYVKPPRLPDIYRMCLGSSQGSIQSGSICDSALLHGQELNGLGIQSRRCLAGSRN